MPLDEKEYASLLDNLMVTLTDAVYFKDIQSRFIKVNDGCARKHGWSSPEEAVGKTDFDSWDKVHAAQAFRDEQEIMRTGQPMEAYEEKEVHHDGTITWAFTTKLPLRDEQGTIIGTFGISRDITERKNAELRARSLLEEIKAIKEEIEDDVRMAGKLQKNFMPVTYPAIPAGAPKGAQVIEFLHRFNLNQQVSGDYCAIFPFGAGCAALFICDVSGLGVRAALGTALVRGIVQEIFDAADDPSAYMKRMNEMLYPLLRKEELALDVTACLFTIDTKTGRLRVANAGHAMPLHFRDGYAAQWVCEGETCVGPALATDPDAEYVTVEQPVSAGDSVVAFTDGLHGVQNTMDDAYGLKRLLDSAHSLAGEPLVDIFDGLEGDALAFSSEGKFADDVCLVGFHLKELLA